VVSLSDLTNQFERPPGHGVVLHGDRPAGCFERLFALGAIRNLATQVFKQD